MAGLTKGKWTIAFWALLALSVLVGLWFIDRLESVLELVFIFGCGVFFYAVFAHDIAVWKKDSDRHRRRARRLQLRDWYGEDFDEDDDDP